MSALTLVLQTPQGVEELAGVVSLRFETPDGARGVLPGHEPSLAVLAEGLARYRCQDDDEVAYLATEGGLALVDRGAVRLVSRWIARAPSMEALIRLVERRQQERDRFEEHTRLLVERHELATRRALAELQREVSW